MPSSRNEETRPLKAGDVIRAFLEDDDVREVSKSATYAALVVLGILSFLAGLCIAPVTVVCVFAFSFLTWLIHITRT